MRGIRFGLVAAVMAGFVLAMPAAPASAQLTDKEVKCSSTLSKSFAKLQSSLLKIRSRCRADDISGKADSVDGCETLPAKVQAKADKATDKFIAKTAKACSSVCSTSNDVVCISDLTCPARHVAAPPNNAIAERCLGKGGTAPLSVRNLDWPGPYCDSILGHAMTTPQDLGECVAELVDAVVEPIEVAIFADLDEAAGVSADAVKCASRVSKAVTKAASKAYLVTAACRDARRDANNPSNPPYACASQDGATATAIQKELTKLSDAIAKSCTNADVAALTGLCAEGNVTPTTVAAAQACLGDLVRELATEERGQHRHVWSDLGMLNVTHPDSAVAYCGDGVVTAKREESTGIGEECDGEADAACPGACLPPGDVFECTCSTTLRERFVVNGDVSGTDSDAGWLGSSHDATHNNGFGYVSELSNCDCDEFTQATCTGASSDDVCDVYANMEPRCSDDLNGTQSCDERGNNNGLAQNRDCFRCDDNSINAGTWCANGDNANETVCESQCIDDATGLPVMPQAPCLVQTDCGVGQTCRGRCDNTITCEEMTEGSPLPLISASNPVCIMLKYKTDIVGTKNIVTGEQAVQYTTRSLVSLGAVFSEPCPVCGGVCLGGVNDGDACFGRCDASNAPCLLDGDCSGMGDTACLETADDCTGGACSLDLRCSAGLNAGKLCEPDASTTLGVVSHDCPPIPNETISGTGVTQPFGTVTTEAVEFPAGSPCTDPSWGNYDCPCPANDLPNLGVPTRPGNCAAACDGGVNEGLGCVTGGGGSGVYTTCVGGTDNGKPCDADLDCDGGGLCNGNPLACTAGDTATLNLPCTVHANCGVGGVCSDPCPGARCVPLCYTEGVCNGGARDGDFCSTLDHCKQCTAGHPSLIGTGCDINARCNTTVFSTDGVCETVLGVTCDITDTEEGLCAAGPQKYRCTGPGYGSIPCTLEYGTCTMEACSKGSASLRGQPCTVNTDCVDEVNVPVSSGCETGIDSIPGNVDDIPGAGVCEPRPEDCYVNNGFAEGGDTLNGQGSPSDVKVNAAFCTPANSNATVNSASGFGGPSRIRREGSAFVNLPSFP
ncbi:MAG: hypothetical protein ABR538_01855 [Candidatus Binatia bacterium]